MNDLLVAASVDASVFELRPDYRALLIAVDDIGGGASDEVSETLLLRAEATARDLTQYEPVEELAHIAAWRDAYRAFGAKPQRTRSSLEALTRRAGEGLPRVDRLTDIYNAISVIHQIPIGGEDLDRYQGPPRLRRAAGDEPFDSTTGGEAVTEYAEAGEVVWTDGVGITCRRWNWRQGLRTRLTEHTTRAIFILDALAPMTDEQLHAVADDLEHNLTGSFNRRLIRT
jgi:DNA/RNA-binding domain of Phe-tRNA-synthetase-like protein